MTKPIENKPTSKKRMREYIEEHALTVKEVERACGYSNGFISSGGEIGADKLALFVENYPDADLYYIVTGRKSERPEREIPPSDTERERIALSLELADVLKRIIALNK